MSEEGFLVFIECLLFFAIHGTADGERDAEAEDGVLGKRGEAGLGIEGGGAEVDTSAIRGEFYIGTLL